MTEREIRAHLFSFIWDKDSANYKAYQINGDPKAAARVKELFDLLAESGVRPKNAFPGSVHEIWPQKF